MKRSRPAPVRVRRRPSSWLKQAGARGPGFDGPMNGWEGSVLEVAGAQVTIVLDGGGIYRPTREAFTEEWEVIR